MKHEAKGICFGPDVLLLVTRRHVAETGRVGVFDRLDENRDIV